MKKKIVHILLCMMLCMAFVPVTASADTAKAAPSGIWTDSAADSFAGGSGTAADPYQIATPEQLAKLAADVNSGVVGKTHSGEYFKLTADLDLSAHRWIPIGSGTSTKSYHSFSGRFDGNGKTITGLYVDESNEEYSAGLFGNFGGYEIKDLTVKDGYVTTSGSDEKAGILIGNSTLGYGMTITVSNCHVSGTVESESAYTGGLVGYNSYGTYDDCTADVTVIGAGKAGGFIGEEFNGIYRNCKAQGSVNGTWSVGGFAGIMFYGSQADRCAAYGKVTANNWNCGGFAGYIEEGVKIENCVAFGDVESKVNSFDPKIGGFAGTVNGSTINISHAAGKITSASSDYEAGGFAGVNENGSSFLGDSFDVEKNAELKALGGKTSSNLNGVEAASTKKVKANICQDFDGKHELAPVEGKAATCTEDGWEPYYKCDACGSMYSDIELRTMIDEPEVIKANGHKFGEWHIIKRATATEKGEKERICEVCKFVEKAEIPATGAAGSTAEDNVDQSARTGDSSMPVLFSLVALLAAVGAAGALYRRKKA